MSGAAACVRMQAAAPDENEMSIPRLLTRSAAEAVGTFVLVFAAAGSVMVTELSNNQVSSLVPSFGSGLVVAAMVYVFGPISGAHINPAVTLVLALSKHMPWRHTPAYWAAQIAGASAAAGTLRLMLGNAAGLGGHSPSGGNLESLSMEIVLTFILLLVISAVVANPSRLGSVSGVIIGGTVFLGTMLGESVSGGSMNPARSFGPALVGWTWTHHWLYWVGPIIGAAAGAVFYHRLHAAHSEEGDTR